MLINSFGFSLAYPFISLYLYLYRGIPMADVGLALLAAAVVGALGQIAGGELCDRFGRKVMMNAGCGLNAIAFALITAAILLESSYAVFLALLCLRELAGGLYRNVPMVMIADVVPPGDRNGAFSLIRIGGNLGFALGPVLGGIIALHSYALMFAVPVVTSVVYLFISAFLLRDTRPEQCDTGAGRGDGGRVWQDRPFVLFCLVSAAATIVYAQMLTTFSTYSGSYGQIDESLIGLLFSLNGLMVVFFQYPVAALLGRFRLTTSLIAGTLLYAIGFSLVGLSIGFWPLFACMFVISVGELVFTPPSMNIVSRMASPESRGRYMSVSSVVGNAGFAFGPAVGGFLMDWFKADIATMWFLLGALVFACGFGFLLLRATMDRKIDAAEEPSLPLVYPRIHR
jgi:MFS family permease